MGASLRRVVGSLPLLLATVASSPLPLGQVPHYFQNSPFSRRQLPVTQVQKELGELVSEGSLIFGPEDPAWTEATERWNILAPPTIQVVVQPAQESDIPAIVKYCNVNNIKYLARNRGHGLTTSLGKFEGLEIDFAQLRGITIKNGGKSAVFQGGTYGGLVIETLWDQGYVATTGSNECVGLTGPALGGGHGRLEGLYGLVSDNIIHLNVVLADGSAIGVNASSHSDLYWAMQGAGHNFGIVTSLEMKIYPREVETWHYHNYIWTGDKLETVFEELNKFHGNGDTPARMGVNFGQISINTTISETEAVLWWSFVYAGSAEDAERLLAPFNAIGAVDEQIGDVPYPEIPGVQGTDAAGGSCNSNVYAVGTVLTKSYNATTERELYEHFNQQIALYPELIPTARLYHEGYATKAAQEVNPALSAYPHRDEIHLMFFFAAVPQGSDLLAPAQAWARHAWDSWNAGEPGRRPATYVNYAAGLEYETLEAIYGYEPWRLDRLRKLKAKYDPTNSFRYYVPIISDRKREAADAGDMH
ncbi:hypothetical protein GGS23DRAFT_590635 [Durotheca rogersii]|uniref:uncharacterized protein n=1 Tax=Durotheca rogersii TaxID=419775 RepID=UPI00221FBC1B|nr:uncharacterized protein GGS23DRAFT_590635 [Durotheca rogersii]KAI5854502.1 hypothetical protein GGS23DRAFT_590635 [Durotheca rogersii]